MNDINYRELKKGQTITVVTAWSETTNFEDITNGHFFKTRIAEVFFEKRGEQGFLRVFAEDADGTRRRVNYVLEENEVRSTGVVVSIAELTARAEMICLNDRKDEFRAALRRSEKSDLEVYPDFDRDRFVVVNNENKHEYPVKIEASNGLVFGSCECGDFKHRNRICKHLCAVLRDTFFGALYGKHPARAGV